MSGYIYQIMYLGNAKVYLLFSAKVYNKMCRCFGRESTLFKLNMYIIL